MTQDTVFACDELAELQKNNAMLKIQNKELLARCDLLEAEIAALKEAVRPVVEDWTEYRMIRVDPMSGEEIGNVDATPDQLDALAALVGDE